MAVVEELEKIKAIQTEHKRLLGDEYQDYDLVVRKSMVASMNSAPSIICFRLLLLKMNCDQWYSTLFGIAAPL